MGRGSGGGVGAALARVRGWRISVWTFKSMKNSLFDLRFVSVFIARMTLFQKIRIFEPASVSVFIAFSQSALSKLSAFIAFSRFGVDRFSKNLPGSFWTSFLIVFRRVWGKPWGPLGGPLLALGPPGSTLSDF